MRNRPSRSTAVSDAAAPLLSQLGAAIGRLEAGVDGDPGQGADAVAVDPVVVRDQCPHVASSSFGGRLLDADPLGQPFDLVPPAAAEPAPRHVERAGRAAEPQRVGERAAAGQPAGDGGGQRVAGAAGLDRLERRRDGADELAVDERARPLVAMADDDAAGAGVDEVLHGRLDRTAPLEQAVAVELLVADLEHVDAALDDGSEPVAGQVGDDAPAVRPDVRR